MYKCLFKVCRTFRSMVALEHSQCHLHHLTKKQWRIEIVNCCLDKLFFCMITPAFMWLPLSKICCSDFDGKTWNIPRISLTSSRTITKSLAYSRRAVNGRRLFTNNNEVQTATDKCFRTQNQRFVVQGIHNLVERIDAYFKLQGMYV